MINDVYSRLGLRHKESGDVGVEIEVQGMDLPREFKSLWRVTTDGSLRGNLEGLEYVLNKPIKIDKLPKALKIISDSYEELETDVRDTVYAGVHVHVNVQHLTIKQLYTYMTAYYLLEEVLVSYCGETRQGNHFCLRGIDAEYGPLQVATSAYRKDLGVLNNSNLRYGSMNPCSLFRYGSLEFRAMRSTKNLEEIDLWANILVALRESSMRLDSPAEVINSMSGNGAEETLTMFLGGLSEVFLEIPNLEEKLYRGARIAQPIAYMASWDEYKDTNVNPFAVERRL